MHDPTLLVMNVGNSQGIIMKYCKRFNISLDEDNDWFNSFPNKSKLINILLAREFQTDIAMADKDPDIADAYKMIKAQRMIKEDFEATKGK